MVNILSSDLSQTASSTVSTRMCRVPSSACIQQWYLHSKPNRLVIFACCCTGPTAELIEEGVRWALQQRKRGQSIYVHCAHGHGRSATVLCACLIEEGKAGLLEDGIELMKSKRPKVKMNARQKRCLRQWLQKRKNGAQSALNEAK